MECVCEDSVVWMEEQGRAPASGGGSRAAAPKMPTSHIQTCGCVTSHGKRDFADAIKLRAFGWGDLPGLPRGPCVITRVLKRGRQRGQVRERLEEAALLASQVEARATGQGTRAASSSWKRQGAGSPPEPSGGPSPAHTWMLACETRARHTTS